MINIGHGSLVEAAESIGRGRDGLFLLLELLETNDGLDAHDLETKVLRDALERPAGLLVAQVDVVLELLGDECRGFEAIGDIVVAQTRAVQLGEVVRVELLLHRAGAIEIVIVRILLDVVARELGVVLGGSERHGRVVEVAVAAEAVLVESALDLERQAELLARSIGTSKQ